MSDRRLALNGPKTEVPLWKVCEAVTGRPVWPADAVKAHMDSALAAAPPQSRLWPMRHALYNTIMRTYAIGAALFCTGAVFAFIFFFAGIASNSFIGGALGRSLSAWCIMLAGYCVYAAGAGLVATVITLASAILLERITLLGPARWRAYHLHLYGGNIHEDVMRRIGLLREVFPKASFMVHSLEQDSEVLDPVLVMLNPTRIIDEFEHVYIDIWEGDRVLDPPR